MADKKKNSSSVKKPSSKRIKPAKPSEEKLSSSEHNDGSGLGGGFTLSLAGDRSLEAFKNWINRMTLSINPNAEDTMTEEQWVKSWKEFWSKADSASETMKANGISRDGGASESKKTNGLSWEDRYPGITEQLRHFQEAELPFCPHCGSGNTASVQVGVIGRTIELAASTKKFKLVPNMVDKLGKYFCNECEKFFD